MLAKAVGPTGQLVLASESAADLEALDRLARQHELADVEIHLMQDAELGLPSSACDLVLLSEHYHHLAYPGRNLWQIETALRPGARLAVVELKAERAGIPIGAAHKMKTKQLVTELTVNRFVKLSEIAGHRWHHAVIFEPRESPATPSRATE